MIQIYYGDGKGKTTAALGLILRAFPNNFKIALFKFFKPKGVTSEDKIFKKFKKNLKIFYPNYSSPFFNKNISSQKFIEDERKLFFKALNSFNKYDIIILDEALDLLKYKIVSKKEFYSIFKIDKEKIEIIITGHYIDNFIKRNADLITEFKKIKHYFDKGIKARKGIEY